jgi:hypothetical protein
MAISSDTLNRLIAALTSTGAGNEVVNQLNTPSAPAATIAALTSTTAVIGTATVTTLIEGAVNALTALVGGGQTGATVLTAMINRVTGVASAADSVKLPLAVPGSAIVVINAHATNALAVFPFLGDAIDAGAANAVRSVAATKTCVFYCAVAGTWNSQLGA